MPKFCPNCGTEISDKVKFCEYCGVKIDTFSLKRDEKSIVEENKESAKFWYNEGVNFTESKEYEKALEAYKKALTFDSKDPDIWNNKCYILNKLAKYDEAVLAGNEGVKLSPQDPEIWDNLCDAYIGCNNREKADECKKNINKIRNLGNQVEKSQSQFLYIPLSRYIIMSVVTFGIYQVYWIYKNWEYLKNRDNLNIHPFWRGIFGVFFVHELLRAIHDDPILNKNKSAQFNPSSLATGWVIIVIVEAIFNRTSGSFNTNGLVFFIMVILLVIELTFFIPVQRYINEANENEYPAPAHYPWSAGHFIMIGLTIFLIVVFSAIPLNSGSSTTTTYNTVTTYTKTEQVVTFATLATVPTLPPLKIASSQSQTAGWTQHISYDDHFSIYAPQTWSMTEVDSSAISSSSDPSSNVMMRKIMYLYSPDLKSMIMIYGMDMSGTLSSNLDIYNDDLYSGVIQGFKSSMPSSGFTVTSAIEDPIHYTFNGYPARHVTLTTTSKTNLNYWDVYFISNGNKDYVLALVATSKSDENPTTLGIMHTFSPT
jgi:hypothetical protein